MTVTHIVLFHFKAEASPEAIKEVSLAFLELKDTCLHPDTKEPYILSLTGGRDHSTEGFQNGHSHAFVAEFASVPDRDYYVDEDPVHDAYKKKLSSLIEKVTVMDYTPGNFELEK